VGSCEKGREAWGDGERNGTKKLGGGIRGGIGARETSFQEIKKGEGMKATEKGHNSSG